MFGAAVESFSIGFGRPIFEVRDKRGTRWRVNWIPLGGFVKFVGEVQIAQDLHQQIPETVPTEAQAEALAKSRHPHTGRQDKHVTFYDDQVLVGRPYTVLGPWKRIAVSLGGPFANFVFAALAFAVIGGVQGVPTAKEVTVSSVEAGSAAQGAGFAIGDVVMEAGGRAVTNVNDITSATALNAGEAVTYKVRRGENLVTIVATPAEKEEIDEATKVTQKVGRLGLGLSQIDTSIQRLNPVEAIGYGVSRTGDALGQTVNVLRRLITGKEGIDKLSGPVGILHLTSGVTEMTMKQEGVPLGEKFGQLFWLLFQLAALLSVGVGFFNLLPIPVLDGGAVVMTLAEAVTGKPLPEKVQNAGLTIGLVCLVTFALVITLQDSIRLPWGS
jgi:regulator of sigma E protease